MKEVVVVDTKPRDLQAGFRKDSSCVDQIAILRRINIEQSCELSSPLNNAFDSVDTDTLWTLLRHYGVPVKIVNLIRSSYERLTCGVIKKGQLTEAFSVGTWADVVVYFCHSCVCLYLLDYEISHGTGKKRNPVDTLAAAADDLALLSYTHRQIQEKTNSVK